MASHDWPELQIGTARTRYEVKLPPPKEDAEFETDYSQFTQPLELVSLDGSPAEKPDAMFAFSQKYVRHADRERRPGIVRFLRQELIAPQPWEKKREDGSRDGRVGSNVDPTLFAIRAEFAAVLETEFSAVRPKAADSQGLHRAGAVIGFPASLLSSMRGTNPDQCMSNVHRPEDPRRPVVPTLTWIKVLDRFLYRCAKDAKPADFKQDCFLVNHSTNAVPHGWKGLAKMNYLKERILTAEGGKRRADRLTRLCGALSTRDFATADAIFREDDTHLPPASEDGHRYAAPKSESDFGLYGFGSAAKITKPKEGFDHLGAWVDLENAADVKMGDDSRRLMESGKNRLMKMFRGDWNMDMAILFEPYMDVYKSSAKRLNRQIMPASGKKYFISSDMIACDQSLTEVIMALIDELMVKHGLLGYNAAWMRKLMSCSPSVRFASYYGEKGMYCTGLPFRSKTLTGSVQNRSGIRTNSFTNCFYHVATQGELLVGTDPMFSTPEAAADFIYDGTTDAGAPGDTELVVVGDALACATNWLKVAEAFRKSWKKKFLTAAIDDRVGEPIMGRHPISVNGNYDTQVDVISMFQKKLARERNEHDTQDGWDAWVARLCEHPAGEKMLKRLGQIMERRRYLTCKLEDMSTELGKLPRHKELIDIPEKIRKELQFQDFKVLEDPSLAAYYIKYEPEGPIHPWVISVLMTRIPPAYVAAIRAVNVDTPMSKAVWTVQNGAKEIRWQ